ncbi:MAG: S8 family serine peptidase, partial [Bacteroidetes bacterium]|nr:S8 family serine peptidase [Bacteroidota bacterium]
LGTDLGFIGDLDEIRIWNDARSSSEILNFKDQCLTGNEADLIAYYDFEDGTGSSILGDRTGNGNDGVLTNMDTNTAWIPRIGDACDPTPPIVITSVVTDESCFGSENGAINLTVTGGTPPFTFLWSNGETTEDIDNLATQDYNVTVTGNVGDTATTQLSVESEGVPGGVSSEGTSIVPCTECFISEYYEGEKNNRVIEIYNSSDSTIRLKNYFIAVSKHKKPKRRGRGGNKLKLPKKPKVTQLVGFLGSGETYVVSHDKAHDDIKDKSNLTSKFLDFKGKESVQLIKLLNKFPDSLSLADIVGTKKGKGEIDFKKIPQALLDTIRLDTIDLIGDPLVKPGKKGYVVGSGFTKDHNLRRKRSVSAGTVEWSGCAENQYTPFSTKGFLKSVSSDAESIESLGKYENSCQKSLPPVPEIISWYRYGEEIFWERQQDVFAFRLTDGQEFIKPTDMVNVDSTTFHSSFSRQLNEVRFPQSSIEAEREAVRNSIRNLPNFDREVQSITQNPGLDNSAEKFYNLTDLVGVFFDDPFISLAEVQTFASDHNVTIHREPSANLAPGTHRYYEFKVDEFEFSSDIARSMWLEDSSMIIAVEPDILLRWEVFTHLTCPLEDLMFNTNATQDYMWYIHGNTNLQGNVVNGSPIRSEDAHARICDCWAQDFDGTGINVAVIDKNGYNGTHEDLAGAFVAGGFNYYTVLPPEAIIPGTDVEDPARIIGKFHATTMSGTIAARANTLGIVGVAPNSKIMPFLLPLTVGNIVDAITVAQSSDVDVVNMSFGGSLDDSKIKTAIEKIVLGGRGGIGTTVVAGAGHDDAEVVNYPAGWDNDINGLIGVMASNPEDFRWSAGDTWACCTEGSTFGFEYGVTAPGSFMPIVTWTDESGVSFWGDDYAVAEGTSLSSALVAGIAAILLDKNAGLTPEEIEDAITLPQNTDQVNSGTYNNYNDDPVNFPGKSKEMGFGRVNCLKALNSVPIGIRENQIETNIFSINNPVEDQLIISNNLSNVREEFNIKIVDLLGRQVYTGSLLSTNRIEVINVSSLSSGTYILVLQAESGDAMQAIKFIKY